MPVVPQYQPTETQRGIPSARVPDMPSGLDGLANTIGDAVGAVQEARFIADRRAEQNAANIADRNTRQMLAEAERMAFEADQYRVQDGLNQLEMFGQQQTFGPGGWRTVTGKDAFSPDADGKPLSARVMDGFKTRRQEIEAELSTDRQRQLFRQHADDMAVKLNGGLVSHQAEQWQKYQLGVLSAGIGTKIQGAALYYNDLEGMAAALDSIDGMAGQVGKIQGIGEAAGREAGKAKVSKAVKQSVYMALQHGDHDAANAVLEKFGGRMEANDWLSARRTINDEWGARMAQDNPEALVTMLSDGDQKKLAPFEADIQAQAAAHGVDPEFMRRQIMAESSANPNAVGPSGTATGNSSIGLAQFQPDTAKRYGIDPTDAKQSIKGQAMYMRDLLKMFDGDYAKAAAGYNWGEGNVQKAVKAHGDNWLSQAPKETRAYVAKLTAPNTGTPADTMTDQEKLAWRTKAQAQIGHGQRVLAAQLESGLKDQVAKTETTGVSGDLVSVETFANAYGADWQKAYADYSDKITAARTLYTVKTMTPAQFSAEMKALKPDENSPDFAREQMQYESFNAAFSKAQSERDKDPMAWAAQAGYDVGQLQPDKGPKVLAQQMQKRLPVVQKMAGEYGAQPAILTKPEAAHISKMLDEGAVDGQMAILKGFVDGIDNPDVLRSTIKQVRPDSPATLVAAHLMGMDRIQKRDTWMSGYSDLISGDDVARTILTGERMLNPGEATQKTDGKGVGVEMPEGFNAGVLSEIGGAFSYSQQTEAAVRSAARAYYAAKMDRTASPAMIEDGLLKEAVRNVTGGIGEHAGQKVAMPFGMDESRFIDIAQEKFAAIPNNPYTKMFDALPLMPVGTNIYAV